MPADPRPRGPLHRAEPVIVVHLATEGTQGWPWPLAACTGEPFARDDFESHPQIPRVACPGCRREPLARSRHE